MRCIFLSGYLFHLTKLIVDSMNLDNVHGEKKDFLKALTKPVTKLVIQLDKKILEKIALGQTEYAEKSLIKVSILLEKDVVI